MSFESLALEEYGVYYAGSEDDSDEEFIGEKCIQLFASLLTSDIEPGFGHRKEEAPLEEEDDSKNPAKLIVKGEKEDANDFLFKSDRLSFEHDAEIGFHANGSFCPETQKSGLGVTEEDYPEDSSGEDFDEAMNSTGDSRGVVRRTAPPPPPAKPSMIAIQQHRLNHSTSGQISQQHPATVGIPNGQTSAIPPRFCATPSAADPASSSTCRGGASSSSSFHQVGAQELSYPPALCLAQLHSSQASSVVSETVQTRTGQCTAGEVGIDEEVTLRARPQVPPKPQIDLVRYSMANVKEELDLDTILGELLELENQLSSREGADQLLLGLPTLPTSTSASSQLNQVATSSNMKVQSNGSLTDEFPAPRVQTEFCTSPDADSAYGDSSSTECSSGGTNRYRNSEISSADSYRGSLNTPSPQQASPKSVSAISVTGSQSESTTITANHAAIPPNSTQEQLSSADLKAAKIREALEKMKEAKMKKIYVKFFLHDGSTQGLLIDERWTVLDTMKKLAEKMNITLTPDHSIVEEYPELHFMRIYEDHEHVVENIEDWLADSKNKLYFVRRPDKYTFIHEPQHYLLTEKSDLEFPPPESPEWTAENKQELLKKFLTPESSQVPELEGYLMLKADGKKSWKKHYFVLRSSGLYYCPKAKMRGTKDLQCLMNVYNNQVYTCTDWKKKYKAPTEFGFAIKHPKIQVKASKYIKYICTDDEKSFRKWVAALRITRNNCHILYNNYLALSETAAQLSPTMPIKVDVPHVSHKRIPSVEVKNGMNVITRYPANLDSPARLSMLSRTTTSDRCSTSSASIAFDQDECGTIKRQPGDLHDLNGFHYQSQTPSTHSNMSAYAYQRCNNGHGSGTPTGTDECDSDEEQFPPPPEVVGVLQRVATPQNGQNTVYTEFNSPYPYNHHIHPQSIPQKTALQPINHAIHQHVEPLISPVGTRNIMSPVQNGSNLQIANSNVAKKTPPPPPKRADTTKLHIGGTQAQQTDLFSELQRATARQKLRIEGK